MLFQKSYVAILICCFSTMILLTKCITDKTPLRNTDIIDPAIVGDWYHVEEYSFAGYPPESITGIRITEEGIIQLLTIETATGKLVFSGTGSPGLFRQAYKGTFTLEVHNRGFYQIGGIYKSRYEIYNSQLIFKDFERIPIIASDYTRSEVGAVITQPIYSNFEIIIDDTVLYNSPTGSAPSAYASYLMINNQPHLHIRAASGEHHLNIRLNNFSGSAWYGNQQLC